MKILPGLDRTALHHVLFLVRCSIGGAFVADVDVTLSLNLGIIRYFFDLAMLRLVNRKLGLKLLYELRIFE